MELLPLGRGLAPEQARRAYAQLLEEAQQISQHILDRLRQLHDHFPTEVPEQILHRVREQPPDPIDGQQLRARRARP
jgi:hypothetical protein